MLHPWSCGPVTLAHLLGSFKGSVASSRWIPAVCAIQGPQLDLRSYRVSPRAVGSNAAVPRWSHSPHPRPFLVGSNSGQSVSLQIYWLPESLAETFDVQATRSLLHSEDHHRTAWNQVQQQRPREDLAVLSEATLEMGVGEASRTNSTAVVLSENKSSGGGGNLPIAWL